MAAEFNFHSNGLYPFPFPCKFLPAASCGVSFAPSDELAVTLSSQHKTAEAIAEYRAALKIQRNFSDALNNLAWILAANPNPQLRNGAEAVQLAEQACALTHNNQPVKVGTLAAAYAEAGRFDDAVNTAQKAHDLAVAQGKTDVAARNLELLQLYRARRPYREEP